MKREREVAISQTVANCLMLLSRDGDYEANYTGSSNTRASHKKPRLMEGDTDMDSQLLHGSPQKPKKTYPCSICGLKFAVGQGLGGHMRKHKAANLNGNMQNSKTMSTGSGSGSSLDSSPNKRKAGEKRVLDWDLNLTPFENNLEF